MAKCVRSVSNWVPKIVEIDNLEFITENMQMGENLLNKRLEDTANLVLDIANDYIQIKQSACDDGDRWDCGQVQSAMVAKLERLNSETTSVIQRICSAELSPVAKHRYFILFSSGTIERLKQLLQIVGRLSELEQRLFLEEQRKPLISQESTTIHALTMIWSATTAIMNSFHGPSREIFKDQLESQEEEYSFIDQLEFSTAGLQQAKILLMDLIITSWIQFNRLVKYEDLIQSLPFLCPCHCKFYFTILKISSKDGTDRELLTEFLPLILDYQSRPSMITQSARQYEIVPTEPCYVGTNQSSLAYFIVWHLYSLSRIVKDDNREIISSCRGILEKNLGVAMEQFIPTSQRAEFRLSPHQEERFKLIFQMLNYWCEKNTQNVRILIELISFFNRNWHLFGDNYFDKSNFRVGGLTIFQLLTKLINENAPLYTADGQAMSNVDKVPTKEELELSNCWTGLLSKAQPPPPKPSTSNQAACLAVT